MTSIFGSPSITTLSINIISAKSYGAVGDGTTNDASAVTAANAAAVAAGAQLQLNGIFYFATPVTITAQILDTNSQIFAATAQVTINNGLPIRPEWFNSVVAGAGDRAIAAIPAGGGTLLLQPIRYENLFQHVYNGNYMSKDNVRIVGTKMPILSLDMKSLGGGTVISGGCLIYANNVEVREVGFDCGFTWSNAFNAGAAHDGADFTYASDALKNAAAIRNGLRLHNVIGLTLAPSSLTHGIILAEGYENVHTTGEVCGAMGVHGVAIKATNVRCQQLTAYCNNSDGIIIKSDLQATAISTDVQVDSIEVRAAGPTGYTPYVVGGAAASVGVLILSSGNNVDKVQIGSIESYGYPVGVGTNFLNATIISDLSIDSTIVDQQGVANAVGVQMFAPAGELKRLRFGSVSARNTGIGFQAVFTQGANIADHCHIDRLEVVNASTGLELGASSYVSVGTMIAENCSLGVYHLVATPKLVVGQLFKDTLTTVVYSPAAGAVVPALSNSWTALGAGNSAFSVDLIGGRAFLKGLVKPGTTSTLTTLPQWCWPGLNKRTIAQGYNGTTQVAVPLFIGSNGTVSVNDVAGGFANCTSWLSLDGISWDLQ